MKVPFTLKDLERWAGRQVVHEATGLVDQGLVLQADFEPPLIKGAILYKNRRLETALRLLDGGLVQNECPCFVNRERGLVCAHAIALALVLIKRATDPERDRKYREETRRAARLARIDPATYLQRTTRETPGAIPAQLRITLPADWQAQWAAGPVTLSCAAVFRGQAQGLAGIPAGTTLLLSKQDEALLFVLEDIAEGPAPDQLPVAHHDLLNLLELLIGRALSAAADGTDMTVNATRMASCIQLDLDRENGELLLVAHTELPYLRTGEFPFYLVAGRKGWIYGAGNFWPLEGVLPEPYHSIYREPIAIPRADVLRFLRQELPVLERSLPFRHEITPDLFTIEPATPRFRLAVCGSPASLAATLYACYETLELVAAKPDAREHFGTPDPDDILRYTTRNLPAEQFALQELAGSGLRGACGDDLSPIVGKREVLNFLGSALPTLRRRGWRVDLDGRVAPYLDDMPFVTPVVSIQQPSGVDWFDVGFTFEDAGGTAVSDAEIQQALRRGDSYITRDNRMLLIDGDAIRSMHEVFGDCGSADADAPGHFRMAGVYAPFVQSSLQALDGIDVEESAAWRERATAFNRKAWDIGDITLTPPQGAVLRPYQADGVRWLRRLEQCGFCGLLADEMGLGKTLQTLTWLVMPRLPLDATPRPALLVCPSSLVDNWLAEAQRFFPQLRTLRMAGADRHTLREQLPGCDLVVTSYALLRRDMEHYAALEFSALVLDEAQHIKNRSTQNALAAKQIRATHRVVLTGTPVENSVSDIWSIMDFLMPRYLGPHAAFREQYELPIARHGTGAEDAQRRLRRKLQPFMLRRLRRDVARDLPPKIESITRCELTTEQKRVYTELLNRSRRQIASLVGANGFNRARMEILATLMKLRQACCHLDLLRLKGVQFQEPSAKLTAFNELVDEAVDSGHRILVFSQFTSMLTILRGQLESNALRYCYLDGATRDRMDVVRTFNTDRDIPVFLISLKAGGTGLNLTGADMVIHFDPWWNPAVEAQATDRAYRIGQKRTVYSIKLITSGTIEEKVVELQSRKQAVIAQTVDGDETLPTAITWEDVQDILQM